MSAQLLPNVAQQFFDSNGNPLVAGKLYSYQAGTTTPLATYKDASASTPNTNPVILDSEGFASVFISSAAYKFILTDSTGVVQWTVDNISIINPGSIDKTMLNSDVAGAALLQNGSGALDVQVDNVSLQIVSNALQVKNGGITADTFTASSKLEVLTIQSRDLTCPGLVQQIPQYEWTTPSQLSNPGSLPTNTVIAAKWSHNGEFFAVALLSSPFIMIYQRSGTTMTKLPDPATLPVGAPFDLAWSPCSDFLAVSNGGVTSVTIYQRSGNSFTKLTNPTSMPPNLTIAGGVSFSPNSDFLCLGYSVAGATQMILYQRSGTTFTDITSSAGGIWNTALGSTYITAPFSWSRDSSLLAGRDATTFGIDVFVRTGSTFYQITGPSLSTLTSGVSCFAFSPNGKYLAVGASYSPYFALYSISNNAFTLMSNPSSMPTSWVHSVSWSANSEYLVLGVDSSPFVVIYQVSTSGTFTKLADPSTLPASAVAEAHFTKTKQFLGLGLSASPYIQFYQTSSTLPSNALLWTREAPNV